MSVRGQCRRAYPLRPTRGRRRRAMIFSRPRGRLVSVAAFVAPSRWVCRSRSIRSRWTALRVGPRRGNVRAPKGAWRRRRLGFCCFFFGGFCSWSACGDVCLLRAQRRRRMCSYVDRSGCRGSRRRRPARRLVRGTTWNFSQRLPWWYEATLALNVKRVCGSIFVCAVQFSVDADLGGFFGSWLRGSLGLATFGPVLRVSSIAH